MLHIAAGVSGLSPVLRNPPGSSFDKRRIGIKEADDAMTVQQNAAGSLRVSLSSSCSPSPKTGGQGVDSDYEDGAGGFRFALPTLHVDSRLPHSRGEQLC